MSDLCALSDVKGYLGITTSNTDAALSTLITNTSAAIEQFCNRVFATASYTETRNGNGNYKLFLRNGPVTAVSGVTVDGDSIGAAPDSVSSGYVFDDMTVYLRGSRFNKGVQNVTVAYTAGYATTPQDVNQACVEWVAWKFAKRSRIDQTSQTLGAQETQAYSLADMPASVKTMLQPYVRWNV